jgi:hypothetical protein
VADSRIPAKRQLGKTTSTSNNIDPNSAIISLDSKKKPANHRKKYQYPHDILCMRRMKATANEDDSEKLPSSSPEDHRLGEQEAAVVVGSPEFWWHIAIIGGLLLVAVSVADHSSCLMTNAA